MNFSEFHQKIRKILEKHLELLKELAQLLLEKEVIESEEFERIVKKQEEEENVQQTVGNKQLKDSHPQRIEKPNG